VPTAASAPALVMHHLPAINVRTFAKAYLASSELDVVCFRDLCTVGTAMVGAECTVISQSGSATAPFILLRSCVPFLT
jgi:hypothetical protein